ncbi:uncharacterized protein LOC111051772 isoform X1 [Nilaparvata lugens]|uniref:uncharacterized protein LOC111051772 isoform X1 n=1 Tax=Nilaparvata lugens TaxID=108931 RepID=UPI00193CB99B|nr:uncharacterized protein LOC111051772 isoform X1 [Nilaparvata lugens]XP_039276330.1 uncharacterized protein LOC111051772 isoform X1 [Nilaparvata lugens]
MTMDSTRVNVPLRVGGGKKMRKRKELDALAGGGKRCGSGGGKRGSGDQLLSESTDEEMWTGGGMRGAGVRASGRYLIRRRTCASMLRACTALLVLACVLATTTVMWLFIDVREQATFLRTQLDQVVAGNQGVPDTLQKCHSISRELQKNQTELFNRITALSQQIAAFNTQVSVVSSGLNKVEKQLKASPELVNVASLSSSVASFGSQIQDLVSTTKQLKETNTRLDETSHALELNITSLKQKVSEMKSTSISPTEVPDSNALASLSSLVNSLRSNLTNINNTLSSKLQWSSEDELRDSKLIQSLRDMTANLSARVTTLESKSIRKT